MFYFSHNLGPDLEATLRAIRSGKVTDEDVNKLMSVFETSGKSFGKPSAASFFKRNFFFQ